MRAHWSRLGQRAPPAPTPALHALGGADAEQIQPVGQHLTSRRTQPQSRDVQRLNVFLSPGQHPAHVVEPVIVGGHLFQIARHPVGFAQFSSAGHDPWVLGQTAEEFDLPFMRQGSRVEFRFTPVDAQFSGISQDRGNPRMCVLNVEDRVVVGLSGDRFQIEG